MVPVRRACKRFLQMEGAIAMARVSRGNPKPDCRTCPHHPDRRQEEMDRWLEEVSRTLADLDCTPPEFTLPELDLPWFDFALGAEP